MKKFEFIKDDKRYLVQDVPSLYFALLNKASAVEVRRRSKLCVQECDASKVK